MNLSRFGVIYLSYLELWVYDFKSRRPNGLELKPKKRVAAHTIIPCATVEEKLEGVSHHKLNYFIPWEIALEIIKCKSHFKLKDEEYLSQITKYIK